MKYMRYKCDGDYRLHPSEASIPEAISTEGRALLN